MTLTMEQPILDSATRSERAEKLMLKLDDLLEEYLNLLDQYQKTRQQLSTQLSSGYMSLAQANFASTSRARYGPDYYDERMQASRKITVAENDVGGVVTYCLKLGEHSKRETDSESVPTKPDSEQIKEDEKPNTIEKDVDQQSKIDPRDPIRWFGLLVPSPLRSAQSKFIEVIEGSVPQLVTLTKELRALEIEIGRLRKSIRKFEN